MMPELKVAFEKVRTLLNPYLWHISVLIILLAGILLLFSGRYSVDELLQLPEDELTKVALRGNANAQAILGNRLFYRKNGNESFAVLWLTRAAENGNGLAQLQLGLIYLNGVGVAPSQNDAKKWLDMAARKGIREAKHGLGLISQRGKTVADAAGFFEAALNSGYVMAAYDLAMLAPKDKSSEEKFVNYLKIAANDNHPSAQNLLGVAFLLGKGVPKSDINAVLWFSRAARNKNLFARLNLALMYHRGRGVKKSEKIAAKLFNQLECNHYAEKLSNNSLINLGNLFYNSRAYEKASYLYKKAADKGESESRSLAAYNLGLTFSNVQNKEEAFKWFLKAAEQENASACLKVGLYFKDGFGVATNTVEARKWFSKAAEKGVVEVKAYALLLEGDSFFEKGDQDSALKKYKMAANLGDASAKNKAGDILYSAQQYQNAFDLFKGAADGGLAVAQFNLGVCYELGRGTEKNLEEAIFWLKKAASQNYEKACLKLGDVLYKLGLCYKNASGKPSDPKKAFENFKQAAEKGFALAHFELGNCYKHGTGTEWWLRGAYKSYYIAHQLGKKNDYSSLESDLTPKICEELRSEADKIISDNGWKVVESR